MTQQREVTAVDLPGVEIDRVDGDDQARRHFDDARALPHPAQDVVAQGHRLEAAFLPRDPDQHPGVHGRGTVQRYRSATGMLSAVMTRHRRQPLGRGGAGPQSQVARWQAGVLHNHSCRMDVHSIRQLGVGSVLATPTPRRSLGRPSRSTAAKAAPRQNHEVQASVCGAHGLNGSRPTPALRTWRTLPKAYQSRGNPWFRQFETLPRVLAQDQREPMRR